jgi:hypothetical protein
MDGLHTPRRPYRQRDVLCFSFPCVLTEDIVQATFESSALFFSAFQSRLQQCLIEEALPVAAWYFVHSGGF